MYFEGNESKSHMSAKDKLFDLIVSRRIGIIDKDGNEYNIFKGEHEDEFLHMESFVMDYNNQVLFSNDESPCRKYVDSMKHPHCNMIGYYGAFKDIPCTKCIEYNFKKETKYSSQYASFRPDIAFGYNGIHKVWLEISNTNPCSKNKIEFCKKNDIVLLEIKDKEIHNFKEFNGVLKFERLEEYVEQFNIYRETDKIVVYVKSELNKNNYVLHKEIFDMLTKNPLIEGVLPPRDFMKFKKVISDEFKMIVTDTKELKKYFGFTKKTSLMISKEEYSKLIKMNYIEEIIKDKTSNHPVIVEPNNSDRLLARCHYCKGKDKAKNFIKTEVTRNNKVNNRYYHKTCLDEHIKKLDSKANNTN